MAIVKTPDSLLVIRIFARFVMFFAISTAVFAQSTDSCNPVVSVSAADLTLSQAFTRLAAEYKFKLTFPASMDRPIKPRKHMELERLIKLLTADMNTVLKHKTVDNCATPVLTHLMVLPVGAEAAYVDITQQAQEAPQEFIYIENMEQYVRNVLTGKQDADMEHMTPEQLEEYAIVEIEMRVKLEEERRDAQNQSSDNAASANLVTQ
jgi:hypothetical protein